MSASGSGFGGLVGLFGFGGLLGGPLVRVVVGGVVVVDDEDGVVVAVERCVVAGTAAAVEVEFRMVVVELEVVVNVGVAAPGGVTVRQSLPAGSWVHSDPRAVEGVVEVRPNESGCSCQGLSSGHHRSIPATSPTTATAAATTALRRRRAARSRALISARIAYQGRRTGQPARDRTHAR